MKLVIVHGVADDSLDKNFNHHWIDWIKEQLLSKGVECETFLMPEAWNPDY